MTYNQIYYDVFLNTISGGIVLRSNRLAPNWRDFLETDIITPTFINMLAEHTSTFKAIEGEAKGGNPDLYQLNDMTRLTLARQSPYSLAFFFEEQTTSPLELENNNHDSDNPDTGKKNNSPTRTPRMISPEEQQRLKREILTTFVVLIGASAAGLALIEIQEILKQANNIP